MTGPHITDEDLDPSDLDEREVVNREARADARQEAEYEPPNLNESLYERRDQ